MDDHPVLIMGIGGVGYGGFRVVCVCVWGSGVGVGGGIGSDLITLAFFRDLKKQQLIMQRYMMVKSSDDYGHFDINTRGGLHWLLR